MVAIHHSPKTKPRVGLALGSGAAKGWAHIGVLEGLAELGVYPDKVAGCSVGALVGAAYANDNLAELKNWVCGFSSWDIISLMDISWRKGGLISGEKVFDVMSARIGADSRGTVPPEANRAAPSRCVSRSRAETPFG